MNSDCTQTTWFIEQLTGDPNAVLEWRCIHDKEKGAQAVTLTGSLPDLLIYLIQYNNAGYGIFAVINALDGQGRKLSNISAIRAHMVDLDDLVTSEASLQRAASDGATMAVNTSSGKYHVYWTVTPYVGNEKYTLMQRKLAQMYNGDPQVTDATRVMRVPGFLHQKGEPFRVICQKLNGIRYTIEQLEQKYGHVNVIGHTDDYRPLGTVEMSAPSLEMLKQALYMLNPNNMNRDEWLSTSSAFKQAGWNHANPETLYNIWSEWCVQYDGNDLAENRKLWGSIYNTKVGWTAFERKTAIGGYQHFGTPSQGDMSVGAQVGVPFEWPEIMDAENCKEYFKDCFFIERTGHIFDSSGRFMNSTQFNGRYGGRQFMTTTTGKLTDEPWKAATRSSLWTIEKVDHIRFLPDEPPRKIIIDGMGRKGLNIYTPAKVEMKEGNIDRFHDFLQRILPVESDRKIILDYMAHVIKYPGFKIPWAPLIQGCEGLGKSMFLYIMSHALGEMYIHSPKAQELNHSGSTFNAWMRGKLMIIVNEIKTDERRELVEILKPMITDERVEIQSKGVDQDMEDNPANWFFFSNYKDAIPIHQNGRRYSVFYSSVQSKADLLTAGMDQEHYFKPLFDWLRRDGGKEALAYWFNQYSIKRGAIPVVAPETSSHAEALKITQSPMELLIREAIEDELPGFKGGYISTLGVIKQCKGKNIRLPNTRTVQTCLENMGYVSLGRAVRAYQQEDVVSRSEIYGVLSNMKLEDFGRVQGFDG